MGNWSILYSISYVWPMMTILYLQTISLASSWSCINLQLFLPLSSYSSSVVSSTFNLYVDTPLYFYPTVSRVLFFILYLQQ